MDFAVGVTVAGARALRTLGRFTESMSGACMQDWKNVDFVAHFCEAREGVVVVSGVCTSGYVDISVLTKCENAQHRWLKEVGCGER